VVDTHFVTLIFPGARKGFYYDSESSRAFAFVSSSCLLSAVTLTFAQSGTSSLRGTVTDPAGAIVPDATITLFSAEIAVNLTTQTDQERFLPVSSGSSGHICADGDCDRVRHLSSSPDSSCWFPRPLRADVKLQAGQRDHNGRGAGRVTNRQHAGRDDWQHV